MSARRFWLGLLLAGSLPLAYACGVNIIKATAQPPNPTLYAKLQDGTVRVDVFEVPAGRVCSAIIGRRDFCVENLRDALGNGLVTTLGRFMKPGKENADFVAEYRMLEFKQSPSQVDPKAVRVSMRWKFGLKRVADGETVIDLDETTLAPQEIVRADLADATVNQMINLTFERIGAELGKQDLSGKPPEPPPPPPEEVDAGPPQVCVPNATQECVGPGACKGGQSCLPDGTGYTECDCGKKKKSGTSSKPKPAPAPVPAPASAGELAP